MLPALAATLLACTGAAALAGLTHWLGQVATAQAAAGSRIVLERWRSGGERR
jgi:hypothetical protein